MTPQGRDLRQGSDVTFLDALRRSPPRDWGVGLVYVALSLLPTGNGYSTRKDLHDGKRDPYSRAA